MGGKWEVMAWYEEEVAEVRTLAGHLVEHDMQCGWLHAEVPAEPLPGEACYGSCRWRCRPPACCSPRSPCASARRLTRRGAT